jgi:CHAT domain-containing protein
MQQATDREKHEFIREVEGLGLGEGLIAIQLRPEYADAFTFAPEVFFLPAATLSTITQFGLTDELLSIGLKHTIATLRPSGPSRVLASSLISCARSSRAYEPWQNALEMTVEAAKIYRSLRLDKELGRSYVDLANTLKDGGLYYEALRNYDHAQQILEASNDKLGISVTLICKAQLSTKLGLICETLRLLDDAEKIIPAVAFTDKWRSELWRTRVDVLELLGRYGEAASLVDRWLVDEKNEQETSRLMPLSYRARLSSKRGLRDYALSAYAVAVDLACRQVLTYRTRQFRMVKREHVDDLIREALEASILGQNYSLAFGVLERAKTTSDLAVGRPQRPWTSDQRHEQVIEKLTADALEEEKARFDADVLQLRERANVAVLSGDTEEKRRCHEHVEWILARRQYAIPSLGSIGNIPSVDTLAEVIQSRMPKAVLLLEYAFVDETLWAFCVTRSTVSAFPCGLKKAEVKMLATSIYEECSGALPTYALAELASHLLSPAADKVLDATRLIVVLPPELYHVPFHAMDWHGKPLIDRIEVVYSPSASVALRDGGEPSSSSAAERYSQCVAFGVPSVSYADCPELPGVLAEVEIVARAFRAATCFTSSQATADRLLKLPSNSDVLHIACHAVPDSMFPMLSRLLFFDRPVFAFEIAAAGTRAGFVFLNACQTGDARMRASGDSEGLTSSFLAAGSRVVLSTCWPVSDESATIFAESLYGELVALGHNPIAATTRAQRSMKYRAGREHPFHWAPFVAFGMIDGWT